MRISLSTTGQSNLAPAKSGTVIAERTKLTFLSIAFTLLITNISVKRYASLLHYANKWRTSPYEAMSHSSGIQPGNHRVGFS